MRRSWAVLETVEPGQPSHESGAGYDTLPVDRAARWRRVGDVDDGYIPVTRGLLDEIRSPSPSCRRPSAGRKPLGKSVARTSWSRGAAGPSHRTIGKSTAVIAPTQRPWLADRVVSLDNHVAFTGLDPDDRARRHRTVAGVYAFLGTLAIASPLPGAVIRVASSACGSGGEPIRPAARVTRATIGPP
jgi:hypothetical protein